MTSSNVSPGQRSTMPSDAGSISASTSASRSASPSALPSRLPATPAILMVSMEPPAAMEDEFNDWYDTEHFPQRSALPGVQASSRWVCLEGWPRWMALYELDDIDVLQSEAYHAMSGVHATPWSKRMLPRTIGRTRTVAQQCLSEPQGLSPVPVARIARLLVVSVPISKVVNGRDSVTDAGSHIGERIGAVVYDKLSARPELMQLRTYFEISQNDTMLWLIAAFDAPVNLQNLIDDIGRPAGFGAHAFNLYAPYCRGG